MSNHCIHFRQENGVCPYPVDYQPCQGGCSIRRHTNTPVVEKRTRLAREIEQAIDAEREACAQVADNMQSVVELCEPVTNSIPIPYRIAIAIRARGEA